HRPPFTSLPTRRSSDLFTPRVNGMLEKLLTEQPNPASASIDALPTEEVLRVINAEDLRVAEAVGREIPAIARVVDAVVGAFAQGDRKSTRLNSSHQIIS